MKKLSILLMTFLLAANTFSQVGINNETPHAYAALDIISTSAGLLIPGLAQTQRGQIISPAKV